MKLLLDKAHIEGIISYDVYRREGGYESAAKAFKMTPEAIVDEVKKAACVAVVVQVFPPA